MFASGYRCFSCGASQPWEFDGFSCPACNGNLDITYDYSAISGQLATGFENGRQGIFRYQPLLPVNDPGTAFPLRVGATPLYKADRLGKLAGLSKLYLKDDSVNPSASFKDRASAVVVRRAIDIGAGVISAASTGNAGSSLACMAAAHGLQSVIFVPETAPPAKLTQALAFGARVLAVRGSYDDAFDLCLAASKEFGWFNRSTGLNPFTREGKKTCAYEIWEDLGRRVPDRVVVPTGDGNILSGIWKGWRDLYETGLIDRLPKIDCAQSEKSDAISQTVQRLRKLDVAAVDWSQVTVDSVQASTLADSISVDQPRDGLAAVQAIIQSGATAITVSDESILDAIPEIASNSGIFAEPAAAASWAAARQMAGEGTLSGSELVVCLITGNGLKDITHASQAAGSAQVIGLSLDEVDKALRN